jgi:hypothetical protein
MVIHNESKAPIAKRVGLFLKSDDSAMQSTSLYWPNLDQLAGLTGEQFLSARRHER